ncbi:hypothetical protein AVEN_206989-1 [Araneus ventricosus]|uniref:Uncharacterized protein n=1 Tax=Araneus ventricosus TaxID=182803 RepID=A0A4Y2KQ70_ARAVE|nr:hypothetical protein AVEN_206989-1 [Araneus ventricosus]
MLAKQSTLNGSPSPDVELPWSHIKAHFRKLMMESCQKEWEDGSKSCRDEPTQGAEDINAFTASRPCVSDVLLAGKEPAFFRQHHLHRRVDGNIALALATLSNREQQSHPKVFKDHEVRLRYGHFLP